MVSRNAVEVSLRSNQWPDMKEDKSGSPGVQSTADRWKMGKRRMCFVFYIVPGNSGRWEGAGRCHCTGLSGFADRVRLSLLS